MQQSNVITSPIILTASRLEAIADKFVFVPLGTSLASMRILKILHQYRELTPKRIGELSGGTKSNVSQRLNHLEEKKYIERTYAAVKGDKRKIMVKITREGEKQLEFITKRLEKAQLQLIKHFSKKEIQQHLEFFKKINSIIDQEEKNLIKIFK